MVRKRRSKKPQTLIDAKKYYKLLLYEASAGNLGTKPEYDTKNETMTFSEKRGLLDSIIKISQLEVKSSENDEVESGFDLIRSQLNGSGASRDRGDYGATEDSGDESTSSTEIPDNS